MPSTNNGLTVVSNLPSGTIGASSLHGKEGLSQLYQFNVSLSISSSDVNAFTQLMGTKLAVNANFPGLPPRCYTGIVTKIKATGAANDSSIFEVTLRPSVWTLTRNRKCRVFQNQSVPEIIKSILSGFNVKDSLTKSYPQYNYCVQYEESDFAFCSRLMEEEGIYYSFEHQPQNDRIVLGDDSTKSGRIPFAETLPFMPDSKSASTAVVTSWKRLQRLRANKVTLRDHQFELPDQSLEATASNKSTINAGGDEFTISGPDIEQYEGMAGYADRFDGIDSNGASATDDLNKVFTDNKRTAQIRMDQVAAKAVREHGASNCPAMCPGYSFKLTGYGVTEDTYAVVSVEHSIATNPEGATDQQYNYSNKFTTIPLIAPYRPRRKTPHPIIEGMLAGKVVGVEGDDITTDPYGRVKVKFYWDSSDSKGLDASCWIRVATIWAGNGYGTTFIPRIDMEVLVNFVNGDPDQPIVVGCVPNPTTMPHHTLPEDRAISGLRTHSVRGDSKQFNELLFNDAKDKEYVQLHAQRNLYTQAEQTQVNNVGASHYMTVGVSQDAQGNPTEDPDRQIPDDTPTRKQLEVEGFQQETISKYAAEWVGYDETPDLPAPLQSMEALNLSEIMLNDLNSPDDPTLGSANYTGITLGNPGVDIGTAKTVGDHTHQVAGNKYNYTNHNVFELIDSDRLVQIDGLDQLIAEAGQNISIDGIQQVIVDGNEYVRITPVYSADNQLLSPANQTIEVSGNQSSKIIGDQYIHVLGKRAVHSHSDKWSYNYSDSYSLTIGDSTSYHFGSTFHQRGDDFSSKKGPAKSTSVTYGNSTSDYVGGNESQTLGFSSSFLYSYYWDHNFIAYVKFVLGGFRDFFDITAGSFELQVMNPQFGLRAGASYLELGLRLDLLSFLGVQVRSRTANVDICSSLMKSILVRELVRVAKTDTTCTKFVTGLCANS